jgi:feruloyl esterase
LRRRWRFAKPVRLIILAALPAALSCSTGGSQAAEDARCDALRAVASPGVDILRSTFVRSYKFPSGEGLERGAPPFCRIVGVVRPAPSSRIGFELWLPAAWNGRYVQLGNGGFAGNIDGPSLAAEIRRGNAAAMTDTGHKADQFDAGWALGQPDRIVDYGHRSIKATSDAARIFIQVYYGRAPRRRYFIGCSNGGRQALMAAQHYPEDWDGILAGAPAVQWTSQLATFAAIQNRLRQARKNWIAAAKLPAIQRAAVASCPPASVSDGVPSDPQLCRLDSRRLLCQAAQTSECLTPAEVDTLDLIRFGPRDVETGRHFYHGFEAASADLPDNWERCILNPDRDAQSQLTFATQAYRNLILERPRWHVEDLDLQRDLHLARNRAIAGKRLSEVLDADDPDLTRFVAHGGKLILYFGWSDALLSPAAGLAYYRQVIARMGGATKTQRFARLFMVPGMQHCQGGSAPNSFGQAIVAPPLRPDERHDVRRALVAWVEKSRAPDVLVAASYRTDRSGHLPTATRLLRPYPRTAGPVVPSAAEIGR